LWINFEYILLGGFHVREERSEEAKAAKVTILVPDNPVAKVARGLGNVYRGNLCIAFSVM